MNTLFRADQNRPAAFHGGEGASSTESYRVGVDIGGTKVNVGLLRQDGSIVEHLVFPSAGAKETAAFADRVCTAVERLTESNGVRMAQLEHIGVGIPGTADSARGVVEFSCNLFGCDIALGDCFAKRLGREVMIVQDSWAAAFAEHRFGAGRAHDNMLCVTVGTGIGCGVILNGKVFSGAMHAAGELGHIAIQPNGRLCGCGRRGCLEAYASGTAILAQAMERFPSLLENRPVKTETVFALAAEGSAEARRLIEECVDRLAYGLALMINILSVDTVVISGGISAHRELVIDPLREKILGYGYPSWTRKKLLTVLPAQLGSDAPMVGAAFLTPQDM